MFGGDESKGSCHEGLFQGCIEINCNILRSLCLSGVKTYGEDIIIAEFFTF